MVLKDASKDVSDTKKCTSQQTAVYIHTLIFTHFPSCTSITCIRRKCDFVVLDVLVENDVNTWFTMYLRRASKKKAVRSSWFLSPDWGGTNGVISSGVTWAGGGETS